MTATGPELPFEPTCTCVVGLQWGDEAKGKLVDILGDQHDYVVRYNGGPNAGHTVVWDKRTFKLSLLPTGVLKPHLRSVIGNGVVVYPPKFLDEIEQLRSAGIAVGNNLVLSSHAHVIFPYHIEEERLVEQSDDGAIGTTGRGIGPCYQDKIGRICGIRVGDLIDPAYLRERLRFIVARKNRLLAALGGKTFDTQAVEAEYVAHGQKLKPFVTDTTHLLHHSLRLQKRLLFEGAQGSLLDIDHGTYPYVTSSSSSPAGIWSGTGVPTRYLKRVIGVVKAYNTRVGRGPFPTELNDGPDGLGERIRKTGREYGTVTGRPRRVGWFDAVAARYTATLAGANEIAVMLLDVLGCVPEISICTGYDVEGEPITDFPSDAVQLEKVTPHFETLPGWNSDISGARRVSDLPDRARKYVDRISELLGLPVTVISVGPDREQTIFV